MVLAVRVVDDLDAAIAHIRAYTSDHTEVIATEDTGHAERFVNALRSAVVMVNASSRFSDGGQLGLGSEIGISTTRLHAYGPMGWKRSPSNDFVRAAKGRRVMDPRRAVDGRHHRSADQGTTEVGADQVGRGTPSRRMPTGRA
jgi:gamma-glutamyl phosphate reductase